MAETSESKQGGAVTFLQEQTARAVSGPLPATVHLFENQYDRSTHFWYGVAEVGAPADGADRDAGGPAGAPAAYLNNPAAFRLRVELADGRWGFARHWSASHRARAPGRAALIAFVCETALVPRAGP
jgi:hypothetical protein